VSSPISDALDDLPMPKEMLEETPARENVSEGTQSRPAKIRKHASKGQSARRHHRSPRSLLVEQQPSVEIRTASGPFNLFASPNFAFERRPFWNNDFQTSVDTNRGRCERGYDCGREVHSCKRLKKPTLRNFGNQSRMLEEIRRQSGTGYT